MAASSENVELELLETMRAISAPELAVPDARTASAHTTSTQSTAVRPRLWIVTGGAQAVEIGSSGEIGALDSHLDASQALLWGLGRTFALEHPDAWGGLCDLDPTANSDTTDASILVKAVQHTSGEDQYAVRNGVLYVPRIERRDPLPEATLTLSPTGKYLVTGGLGHLGLRVAEWLADHGARHIVLNGRTGLPDRAQWEQLDSTNAAFHKVRAVQAIESRGATVTILQADLSHPDAAHVLYAQFASGELRGVIHSAAVFDTHLIDTLQISDLRAVVDTKARGAQTLSDLIDTVGADFCVLFSSTTSLLGYRGMGAYAAANQFLDTFAHQRRAAGQPMLAVNWGTWDELGDLPESERQAYLRAGLCPMPSVDALDTLGRAIVAGETQLTVAQIDWTALKTVYQARRRRPMLSSVSNREVRQVATTTSAAPKQQANTLASLVGIPETERKRRLIEMVRAEAASVLALRVNEVDPQLGLFEMGMDSLMSVELRSRLERRADRKLPSTLTFNYPNVTALAGYLDTIVASLAPSVALQAAMSKGTAESRAQTAAIHAETAAGRPRTAEGVMAANTPSDGSSQSDDRSEDEIAALLSDVLNTLD
jgi:myxalamid-type polyketide synthase MxaE and MxaD